MAYNWRELNIDTRGRSSGTLKTRCPECHDTRRNKADKSLSVNLDKGLYLCHHCGWSGKAESHGARIVRSMNLPKKSYRKPNYETGEPQDKLIAWFQARGISEATVRRNRIEARSVKFDEREERAIAFPFIRKGQIVNVQYRTTDKRFKLEAGCELVLYGLDDIQAGEPLIFVEGQIDKLSLEEAGYKNCVSVPNGANLGGGSEWLLSAQKQLDECAYFVLAGDNDEPGQKLTAELIRRLGPERCWRVEWPEDCKDANDTLVKHGRTAIIDAIECAQPLPIVGIVSLADLYDEVWDLYFNGIQPGVSTGWDKLTKIYKPRLGEMTILTGPPNSGKSTFLDALLINLAWLHQWRTALFSPEQLPLKRHVASLLEVYNGQPFNEGRAVPRMDRDQVQSGMEWLDDYFKFIQPEESDLSIDGILKLAKACVTRYGIQQLVIDPWNEIGHTRPDYMSETDYIDKSLSKIRRFARMYGIHIHVIVHPTKLQKQTDGSYPIATPYDLHGSAHWFNKADMILSVWRDKKNPNAPLQVHSQKVRFKENGELGFCELYWDRTTGRLTEKPNYYAPPSRSQDDEDSESGYESIPYN